MEKIKKFIFLDKLLPLSERFPKNSMKSFLVGFKIAKTKIMQIVMTHLFLSGNFMRIIFLDNSKIQIFFRLHCCFSSSP